MSHRTEKFSDLAARLGVSERTCKGWEAAGVRAKDPVPWGEPLAIVEWFKRVKGRHISAKLKFALESAADAGKEESENSDAEDIDLGELFATRPPENAGGMEDETVTSLWKVLFREAREIQRALERAKRDQNAEMVRRFRADLVDITGKLRQLEKTRQSEQQATGEYVSRAEVQAVTTQIHLVVRKQYRQAFRRARGELAAAGSVEEWAAIVDATADQADAALVECEFREVKDE